jgi:hypothetical protein
MVGIGPSLHYISRSMVTFNQTTAHSYRDTEMLQYLYQISGVSVVGIFLKGVNKKSTIKDINITFMMGLTSAHACWW